MKTQLASNAYNLGKYYVIFTKSCHKEFFTWEFEKHWLTRVQPYR